jgi:hypothetical protein
MTLAVADSPNGDVTEVYPGLEFVDDAIPEPASSYLTQALESLHAPAGAVMLCASAVDAMLKRRGYSMGSLFDRVDKAVEDGVLTAEMGEWAHEVRLEANEPRHADVENPLPTALQARKCLEFTETLGLVLFVLPARVKRGRATPAE